MVTNTRADRRQLRSARTVYRAVPRLLDAELLPDPQLDVRLVAVWIKNETDGVIRAPPGRDTSLGQTSR